MRKPRLGPPERLAARLKTAEQQLARYIRALDLLPAGRVVKRMIGGRAHYFTPVRRDGKLVHEYRGRTPPGGRTDAHHAAKRVRYRKLIKGLQARIAELKAALAIRALLLSV
ncbi:MAG: hypothetical protein AAB152_17300 [Candidatus Coatesbacteria bacterium]